MLHMHIYAYLFHSDGEHESVTGFEHLDGILVGDVQQALSIHVQDLITNLYTQEIVFC